jgi:hypothetical protein
MQPLPMMGKKQCHVQVYKCHRLICLCLTSWVTCTGRSTSKHMLDGFVCKCHSAGGGQLHQGIAQVLTAALGITRGSSDSCAAPTWALCAGAANQTTHTKVSHRALQHHQNCLTRSAHACRVDDKSSQASCERVDRAKAWFYKAVCDGSLL